MAGVAALSCAGQTPPQPLSLQDCVRLAESGPSPVTQAQQEAEIARYGITQARSGFLPQMHLGNSYVYNSPRPVPGEFSFVSFNGVREYIAQFNAAQEIDTSGRLRSELARARADRDAAQANLGIARRDLRRAVTTAYYRLLLARHLASVNKIALDEARSFEDRTRKLTDAGEAARADLVKASAQAAFFAQAAQAAELEARMANHELASFWTRDVEAAVAIQDTLQQPVPAPDAGAPAQANMFLQRLEFNLAEAQRRGFQADARRARADLYPQLSLVFQYGLDSTRFSFRDRGYATFVNLNIPVFDWFRARSASRQFQLRARQVETNREITARTFSRDYQDALSRVRFLYEQISLTVAQATLSEENLRLSRIRYEGGEGPSLDVVAAQSQLAQARSNHLTAIASYLNARADLEVASGK
jgi:outer membrane protein